VAVLLDEIARAVVPVRFFRGHLPSAEPRIEARAGWHCEQSRDDQGDVDRGINCDPAPEESLVNHDGPLEVAGLPQIAVADIAQPAGFEPADGSVSVLVGD